MKLRATLASSILLLAACQSEETSTSAAVSSPSEPAQALQSGIDLSAIDKSVRPQDDFFKFTNGKWLADTEIPADRPNYGTFALLYDKSQADLRTIIEHSAKSANQQKGSAAQQVGDLYASFMDEVQVTELGRDPIATNLARIKGLKNLSQVYDYLAWGEWYGLGAPFSMWVDQDAKNVESYILYFTQSGLGLPDKDYYFDESDRGKQIVAGYHGYLAGALTLLGWSAPDSVAAAQRVIDFETALAAKQWSKVENRDRDKTYNKKTRAELTAMLQDFPLDKYLKSLTLDQQQEFIVRQPDYIVAVNEIMKNTPIQTWQEYLAVRLFNNTARYLSAEYVDHSFNFYSKTLRGIEENRPRWKRAVSVVNGSVGELVGQTYVAKHFPPEAKQRMVGLVDNLVEAYRQSINDLPWMSAQTKEKALYKLGTFVRKIGYPDKWRDYNGLDINADDLLGNMRNIGRYQVEYELSKLGKPVDRQEWFMTPQTVNAYYNPPMNEIVFPAAILQTPFFNLAADDAVNYGAIGAVIGHEIGHGFDDQGSKYDGDGYLRNWWTDADRSAFEGRTKQLVKQYNAFEPFPDVHINGELTLGENIGDLSGVTIAYKAYQLSLNGKPAEVIDEFTGEQRFFLGYAQAWRAKGRPEAYQQQINTDPHSLPEYRVMGVLPNVDAFYQAFEVKETDTMYLQAQQRVKIW